MADQRTITVTPNLAALFHGNVGLVISPNFFTVIANGDVVLKGGCIRFLRYGNDDDDLVYVLFDNGDFLSSTSNATNLKDFRQRFQDAANNGLGCTYCEDTSSSTISMVNLYPCLCTCREGEGIGKGKPATDFFSLSGS